MVLSDTAATLLGGGISALGNIGSGLLGSLSASGSAYSSYKYSKKLMKLQNKYNTQMFNRQVDLANSAHQREVADLKAAGLNPILSATGGSGLSTPSAASSGSATMEGADYLGAINSAIQNKQRDKELKTIQQNADTESKNAETAKNRLEFDKEQFAVTSELAKQRLALDAELGFGNLENGRISAIASKLQADVARDSNPILNLKNWAKDHPYLSKAAITAIGFGKFGLSNSAKSLYNSAKMFIRPKVGF